MVDSLAANAFDVNTNADTITIKAAVLLPGSRFTSLRTTGTVSTSNGATLEFGYEDGTGINKFVHLDWNENRSLDISVEDTDNNAFLIPQTTTNEIFKGHFLVTGTPNVRTQLSTLSGFVVFSEIFPTADLNFIREDVTLTSSEEAQRDMLYLSRKLLQKTETVNQTLKGTNTPSIIDSTSVTELNAAATNENQVAIIQLLQEVLKKASSMREAIPNN